MNIIKSFSFLDVSKKQSNKYIVSDNSGESIMDENYKVLITRLPDARGYDVEVINTENPREPGPFTEAETFPAALLTACSMFYHREDEDDVENESYDFDLPDGTSVEVIDYGTFIVNGEVY